VSRLLVWASAAAERVNPVVVKEFRQAVRSRLVIAVLLLFLLINLAVLGGYLALSPQAATSADGGRNVFAFLVSVLFITCLGFVPLYTGARLSLERNDVNSDLLFITTITPGAMIRGKYLTAMALTLLIFSACMPFLVFTYLLRGIDLPTIFYVLAIGFLSCSAANAVGVLAGSVPGSWFGRFLLAVGLLIVLLYSIVLILSWISFSMMFGGFGPMVGPQFWATFGTWVLMIAMGIGLFHVFSVALISPKAANRMLVPRLYVTVCWAVTGIVTGLWCWYQGSSNDLEPWTLTCSTVFAGLAVLALGERDTWSRRVQRTIPENRLLRLGAFLFYTGSAGGILWCTLLFGATLVVGLGLSEMNSSWRAGSGRDLYECCTYAALFYGYVLCYCLTAAFLRLVVLKKAPTIYLPLTAILLGIALCLGPYLVGFFAANLEYWRYDSTSYLMASPVILSTLHEHPETVVGPFLCGWIALCLVASARWFIGQWRRFVPVRAQGSGFGETSRK